jgi:hypothetical protein
MQEAFSQDPSSYRLHLRVHIESLPDLGQKTGVRHVSLERFWNRLAVSIEMIYDLQIFDKQKYLSWAYVRFSYNSMDSEYNVFDSFNVDF